MLNRFSMTLGRFEAWGIIDELNMNTPANAREAVLTYQCVVKQKMRCTADEYCASSHCTDVAGS